MKNALRSTIRCIGRCASLDEWDALPQVTVVNVTQLVSSNMYQVHHVQKQKALPKPLDVPGKVH